MPEFEILEFLAMIIVLIPLTFSIFIIKRRKDMIPLFPGVAFIFLSFICTNLEAFVAPDAFNFLEHLFIMLGGISFLLGMIFIYYNTSSNKSSIISKSPKNEGW